MSPGWAAATECIPYSLLFSGKTHSIAPIYNFTFTAYGYCIISEIWYPIPDGLGSYNHITLGDPLVVKHYDFKYSYACSNPNLKYSLSISFGGSSFTDTLPPFLSYDNS